MCYTKLTATSPSCRDRDHVDLSRLPSSRAGCNRSQTAESLVLSVYHHLISLVIGSIMSEETHNKPQKKKLLGGDVIIMMVKLLRSRF